MSSVLDLLSSALPARFNVLSVRTATCTFAFKSRPPGLSARRDPQRSEMGTVKWRRRALRRRGGGGGGGGDQACRVTRQESLRHLLVEAVV
eukprot:1722775-Pyramimonas_sp.AAC.1